ncbi:hypothetical protein E1B25_16940 [Antarcticimicrobium sediminis]|uniref:Uncharacterized protein n=2 Tax=Antarcticimicrobium sediminis TaxID=2546227 RepID=A0A4R5EML7_9RHOB|nr:hypothetical protein E1B25_16940 [Antarcticimicrobium sediminis]
MLGPIEQLYQKGLLPGFSSVTTRIRYYSFHAWWLTRYADAKGGQSTSQEIFQDHTRRVEALFALSGLAAKPDETGLAGYFFARDKLAEAVDPVDFRRETDRQSGEKDRYLSPMGGAFPGIYAGQMEEIGLISKAKNHDLMVPTKLGRRLAAAFEAVIKDQGDAFLAVAEEGVVSRDDLARFSVFAPSGIDPHGEEAELLRALLMGYEGPEDSGECRGATLRAILEMAAAHEDAGFRNGVSANGLRWEWHAQRDSAVTDVVKLWAAYQAGDVLRTSYEALLRHATLILEEYPDGTSLSGLVGEISAPLSGQSFRNWRGGVDEAYRETDFEELQESALVRGASLDEIIAPVARLARLWSEDMDVLEDAYPPTNEGQTVYSELKLIKKLDSASAERGFAQILDERVIRRHLRVAARKFHGQNNYTFLIEAESGTVRARESRTVEASGPRLGTAVQFLNDICLLKDGRITALGRRWMHRRENSLGGSA